MNANRYILIQGGLNVGCHLIIPLIRIVVFSTTKEKKRNRITSVEKGRSPQIGTTHTQIKPSKNTRKRNAQICEYS